MSVVRAAWMGAGSPPLASKGPRGICSRCGAEGHLTATREVVSAVFTGYDHWVHPAGPGLCEGCTWSYRTPSLRSTISLVTRDPARYQALDRTTCLAILQCAVPAGMALVVPLRPGRKHLLPIAQWGMVATDAAVVPWNAREAALLQLVVELRRHGFGSRMLMEPAVPFTMLQRLPAAVGDWVMAVWGQLDEWRVADSPWFPLALHVSMPGTAGRRAVVSC